MPPPLVTDSPEIRKLARALREDNKGRGRFSDFSKDLYESTAGMFVRPVYNTLTSIKDMQELGRAYFLQGIRKERKPQPNYPDPRLLVGLFETYAVVSAPKARRTTLGLRS